MQQSFELFADMEREYCRRIGAQDYRILKRALLALGERRPSSNEE